MEVPYTHQCCLRTRVLVNLLKLVSPGCLSAPGSQHSSGLRHGGKAPRRSSESAPTLRSGTHGAAPAWAGHGHPAPACEDKEQVPQVAPPPLDGAEETTLLYRTFTTRFSRGCLFYFLQRFLDKLLPITVTTTKRVATVQRHSSGRKWAGHPCAFWEPNAAQGAGSLKRSLFDFGGKNVHRYKPRLSLFSHLTGLSPWLATFVPLRFQIIRVRFEQQLYA